MINNQFKDSQDTKTYADVVYVCDSEYELLLKLIDILTDKKYHIISHFNGWNFDERMIMSRMCLYGYTFEYYYQRIRSIRNQISEQDQYMLSYKSSYKNGTVMS